MRSCNPQACHSCLLIFHTTPRPGGLWVANEGRSPAEHLQFAHWAPNKAPAQHEANNWLLLDVSFNTVAVCVFACFQGTESGRRDSVGRNPEDPEAGERFQELVAAYNSIMGHLARQIKKP